MTNQLKLGTTATEDPTDAYIAFFPCFQAAADTSLLDRSGRGIVGTFASGLTASEAWTTQAKSLSTLETTTPDDVTVALADFNYSWAAGDSLVIAARVDMAAPAATRTLFGQGFHSTNAPGFRIIIKNTGVVAPWVYQAGGDKFLSDSTMALADAAWHSFMFAWFDHDVAAGTAKYMVWVDGVRGYATETATTGLTTMVPIDPFRIGGNKTGASAYQSSAASFQGIHLLRSASSKDWTYESLDAVARRLHKAPITPLLSADFPSA
jgi:hypothetical protein